MTSETHVWGGICGSERDSNISNIITKDIVISQHWRLGLLALSLLLLTLGQ